MPRVLLVEDDQDISERLRDWLAFNKFVVVAVNNAHDALEELRFRQFDFVLLDWNLPGLTGLEICQKYRTDGGKARIIMLTGQDSPTAGAQAAAAGADAYIQKPFSPEDLITRMNLLANKQNEAATG